MARSGDPAESERAEPARASGEQPLASIAEPGLRALLRALDGLDTRAWILDREGCYVFVNDAAEQALARPSEHLVGRHYLDHVPASVREVFDRGFRAVLADGEARTLTIPRPDLGRRHEIEVSGGGAWVLVLWRDVAVADEASSPPYAAEQHRIEAERARLLEAEREARAAAEDANQAKDAFLATVSHELRTPLSAMLGWARMLRTGTLGPERVPHALAVIERNALAQAQIVEDLLDVSRIVAGKLRLEVVEIDLAPILDAAVAAVRPALDAKRIHLEQRAAPGAGRVLGDPGRLQQVVWNLLANATKFTPAGGRIDLSLERVGAEIVITVADSGPGIAPELMPRLFARFQQADMSTTRLHGGLGLGLAIARHLVELHGGAIGATSGHGGATFVVRLPLAPDRPRALRSSRPPRATLLPLAAPRELRGLRVLLIDDQEDIRDLVVNALHSCGAVITAVASARDAREAMRRALPDVILCDIAMPVEDGFAFVTWLRALRKAEGGLLPCGALTAYARAEDRRRILDAGYNLHVPKPAEPEELVQAVLSLSRMARAMG